ncbi:hypothetical protein ABT272_40565 [Streptomyces sp900105245]|uniref:Uncharacterized protein n=1 Tax=Streptomyces sp. 900105245 TaxID=3154379 RepID=A0ABV1UJN3_9ACTN
MRITLQLFDANCATEILLSAHMRGKEGKLRKILDGNLALAAAEKIAAPQPIHIAISLTVGLLFAIAAGALHRSDRPDPTLPDKYSIYAAVMRAGVTLFGTSSLVLTALISPRRSESLLVLLLSAAAAAIFGLLARLDQSTIQAAIWRGATIGASASAFGQAFLTLYT